LVCIFFPDFFRETYRKFKGLNHVVRAFSIRQLKMVPILVAKFGPMGQPILGPFWVAGSKKREQHDLGLWISYKFKGLNLEKNENLPGRSRWSFGSNYLSKSGKYRTGSPWLPGPGNTHIVMWDISSCHLID
jgi:hypothetical protein